MLITGARAPVALHLARLLHGVGRRVILADSPAHPIAAASTACALYRRLPPPRFAPDAYAEAVEALVRSEGVVLVIPTCEEVFYLGQLWRDRAMTARLFAPDMDLLARVHDKHAFIRLVESLGLAVPKTTLLQSRHDLQAVHDRSRELVFKPVWSRFASHVLLRPSPEELDAISPSPEMPWVAQRFIAGEEISAYAVARDGKLKALAFSRSLYRAGKGAGICFERVENVAARELRVALPGLCQQRFARRHGDDGVHARVECVDAVEISGHHLDARNLLRFDSARKPDAVHKDDVGDPTGSHCLASPVSSVEHPGTSVPPGGRNLTSRLSFLSATRVTADNLGRPDVSEGRFWRKAVCTRLDATVGFLASHPESCQAVNGPKLDVGKMRAGGSSWRRRDRVSEQLSVVRDKQPATILPSRPSNSQFASLLLCVRVPNDALILHAIYQLIDPRQEPLQQW
ncbi:MULTISPECIES: hypothetical protein [unclassified Mesorhizobium]|uniref:hypothetical protein n=1 Tax=unclassified Mesorhizobium TaxID=325217 RepID=UPI0018DB6C35|nr:MULTISPECIES: hypothetical protein [unclassified Mesorhizobium]WJI78796.1 hypothetical protein NLY34_18095 [Mesorhizobium sp. C374B]WJI85331.1 hypothetical protein NLY42_20495 [Mesorhizobium sp. C372A]